LRTIRGSSAKGRRTRYLAVVQHGRDDVYRTLKTEFEERAIVAVTWDRRREERRREARPVGSERRRGNRRRGSPATWQALGFVLVPESEG
jgi:hypothetical protein